MDAAIYFQAHEIIRITYWLYSSEIPSPSDVLIRFYGSDNTASYKESYQFTFA